MGPSARLATWAGRGTLGWGGGEQAPCNWILEAAMMLPLSPILEIKNVLLEQ